MKKLLLCLATLTACAYDQGSVPAPSGQLRTLRLEAGENGELQYCDESGECRTAPNSAGCDVVVLIIDSVSGRTCEQCFIDDALVYEACEDTNIGCTVVTAP